MKNKNNSKPLGPQVVSDVLSIVEKPVRHGVYFDNFFTSYLLLRDLHEKGSKALGTIRENRTTKCPLRPSKSVEKEKRGFFDYRSDECVSIVLWKDNTVVYMGSNFCNIKPTKMLKRYSQRERKRIDCVQPFCFYLYNQGMGGRRSAGQFYKPIPVNNSKKNMVLATVFELRTDDNCGCMEAP